MKKDPILKDLEENFNVDEDTHTPIDLAGSIKLIVALIVLFTLILWVVPHYSIQSDPNPDMDFVLTLTPPINISPPLDSVYDLPQLEVTQYVRNTAIQITSKACFDVSATCYAKALFFYVKDNIQYLSDPDYEYVQHPEETLLGAGDCEDKSILLISLLYSIGLESELVIVPQHTLVKLKIPDSKKKYQKKDGWIYLDPTCRNCEFGEISPKYSNYIVKRNNY
jgi:hypothetical protein